MPGDSSENEGGLIMHNAAHQLLPEYRVEFSGSDILHQTRGRFEHGPQHRERFKECRIDKSIERYARYCFNNLPERDEIEVAVNGRVAGRIDQIRLVDRIEDLLRGGTGQIKKLEGWHASVMKQQIADRDSL